MCCITFLLRVQAGLIAPSLQLSGREKHGGGGGGRCGGGGVFKLSLGSSVSSRPRRLFDIAQVAWRLTRMGFEKHMSTVYSPRAMRPVWIHILFVASPLRMVLVRRGTNLNRFG